MIVKGSEFDKLQKQLQKFATEKSRVFTNLKVKVEIEKLPHKETYSVAARSYTNTFYPTDKRYTPWILNYRIVISPGYLYENRNNLSELHQCIIHELAHLKTGTVKQAHGVQFKKNAKELGADTVHLNQKWD
jgi:predicted SprT family Zn-dependent metalloprotease